MRITVQLYTCMVLDWQETTILFLDIDQNFHFVQVHQSYQATMFK